MGSITKRADGRWRTRVWTGEYKDGKRVYTYLYSKKSARDLEKKALDYEMSRRTGLLTVKTTDIYKYAVQWLDLSKSTKEKRTYNSYKGIIDKYIKTLEGFNFDLFSYQLVQGLINDNKEHPRTCQLIALTLKQIGKSAERDKLLPRGATQDVFEKVSLPKRPKPKKRPLTELEKDALFKANFSPVERAFVYTLYYTGMRKEEALALTVGDIRKTINVNKAVGYDKNTPYLKSPKTERGVRQIPVPEKLREFYNEYNKDRDPSEILINLTGGYISESSYETMWARIKKKMHNIYPNATEGFTDLTAHLFRHNYCTQLCYQSVMQGNITTKKIAELLGDSEAMVINVYSHIVSEKESTDEAIENALKLSENKSGSKVGQTILENA